MNFILFLILIFLVYLLGYLPGRILVQPLPLDDKVKFSLSFGISFFIFFLAGFSSYILNISHLNVSIFLSIFILTLGIIIYRKYKIIISKEEIIFVIIFFAAFLYIVSIQGLIPYYSGAGSYWDWYEHYLRSKFFYNHLPPFTDIYGYFLPQRMPLFNAAAAYLFSIFGSDFWVFQVISTLFNLSVLLPIHLIFINFYTSKNQHTTIFLYTMSIFLLTPFIIGMMVTFTITKAMASYYVLLGLYFFLQAYKNRQTITIYLSILLLALAHLVHYVTLPYIIVIILAFLNFCLTRKYFFNISSQLYFYILVLFLYGISGPLKYLV